jgi:hypothetical protein
MTVLGAAGGIAIAGPGSEAARRPAPDVACATVDDRGLIASVRATGPARIQVEAWPAGRPQDRVRSGWARTNEAHAAELTLPGVGGRERPWVWRGLVRPASGSGSPLADRLRRLPPRPARSRPSAFTFAFGSCILQRRPIPSLAVARAADPQFFAMLGDLGYQDDVGFHPHGQTYGRYVELFRRILRRPDLARLLDRVPLYAVQDDHDYGQDDAWRETIKEYAARAYADVIPGVRWPEPDYRRWSIGEVDFFLTDNRRYRDPPQPPFENGVYRSVLGSEQRAWLLDGMAASDARVKVVFSPMTMAWYWSKSEREDVLAQISSRVSGTVIVCSGDKHAGAFVRHDTRVWELLASPLQNPVKHRTPPRPGVLWTENGADRALWNVVGVVDVETRGAGSVTLRLLREDGRELHREAVPLA